MENKYENNYKKILKKILYSGIKKKNRTGIDTYSLFSESIKIDFSNGFPFLTSKKLFFKNVRTEFVWFINGETNIKRFKKNNVSIWDAWADKNGELGPVYGYQLRQFNSEEYDQLFKIASKLLLEPDTRRAVISLWNPLQLNQMKLPPCYIIFHFLNYNGKLNLQIYQRSADFFIGVPYDIALYSLFLLLMSKTVNLTPGEISLTMGDCHIYINHIEGIEKYLSNKIHSLPQIQIKNYDFYSISEFDFNLTEYNHEEFIKVDIAI